MAGVKIVDLPALGRDLINTDLLEVSLNGGGSRKITGQEIMNASKLAIGSTPIVSGTVGRLLFQGAGNVLSQPSSLFYDAVNNRLGIGTTTPGASLDVVYESTFQSRIDMYGTLYMYNNITSLSGNIWLSNGYAIGDYGTGNNRIEFYSNRLSFFGNGNEALRIVGSTGNLLVNTVTDAGYKFDVNGTARIQNDVLLTTGILATSAGTTRLQSVLNFFSHNRLGSSGTFGWDIRTVGAQNSFWRYNTSSGNTEFGSNSYGVEFYGANTLRTTMTSGGNWLINTTTDAGFRLDVNGTARVQTSLQIGGSSSQGGISATDGSYTLDYTTTTANGRLRLSGVYPSFQITNAAGNLRALISNDGPNGTLTLHQNGTGNVFLNGAASGHNNYIATALSVGSTSSANTTSILELTSTTRGFLPPRMTTTQRNAIASPAAGLVVYDNTDNKHYGYNGTTWNAFY